jgi:hypothetical protein
MSSGLWRRIKRIEDELFLPSDGAPPMLIRVASGLPGCWLHASIGRDLHLEAEPGESQAGFESRCLDEAVVLGASFVVVGGLPRALG